jgi:peptide/nickel transport system ATP-binding protein
MTVTEPQTGGARASGRPAEAVLEVRNLTVDYLTPRGVARAVDRVSFSIGRGEVFGLAGESGCGKSTAAHAILRLIRPPGQVSGGQVLFEGRDVLAMPHRELRAFRWRGASIVLQSAMNALNPVLTIGRQIEDAILAHRRVRRSAARERAEELFDLVGVERHRLGSYPHQLSGGMRQRSVIAMALALDPELIILDEPTTALDVVVQRDILQQIEDLQAKLGFSLLFITHDLSLLVEISTRIAVMYAGRIVEHAPARDLFTEPLHPYTVGLMSSFPSIAGNPEKLEGIPGSPPDLVAPPAGCRFHPRCPHCQISNAALHRLQTEVEPQLRELRPGHWVACHLYD